MLRKLFADQNEQNPTRRSTSSWWPGTPSSPSSTTRAASGQPQDFVESGGFAWVGFAEQGMFTELTPLFKRDKIDRPRLFFPEAVSINSKEGKIWGWPSSVSADAIAVNLDLFDAAGLKSPPVNPDDTSLDHGEAAGERPEADQGPRAVRPGQHLRRSTSGPPARSSARGRGTTRPARRRPTRPTTSRGCSSRSTCATSTAWFPPPTRAPRSWAAARRAPCFFTGKIAHAGRRAVRWSTSRPSAGCWPRCPTPAPGKQHLRPAVGARHLHGGVPAQRARTPSGRC